MAFSKEEKAKIVEEWAGHENDTGSVEVQIALITKRISDLTEHLKIHKKDVHSRYGLVKMVGRRKRLLSYLKRTNFKRYTELTDELGIRG
ncbi:MAG: 30S ribosomal protein S15 [Candidatus Hydrothermia bacterium]